jgi:hypothetical protein
LLARRTDVATSDSSPRARSPSRTACGGDSSLLVAVATHGGGYLPPFHGRVHVTLLGEEYADGTLTPPRLRSLPNSPVFVLDDAEAGKVLGCGGDVRLGLVFVTQLPNHLPRQVLGLCNSFVLHKLTDPQVAANLERTVAGIDDGLWDRLPWLTPRQAIAAFPHFTRPVLVSIDPAPGKLRLVD